MCSETITVAHYLGAPIPLCHAAAASLRSTAAQQTYYSTSARQQQAVTPRLSAEQLLRTAPACPWRSPWPGTQALPHAPADQAARTSGPGCRTQQQTGAPS